MAGCTVVNARPCLKIKKAKGTRSMAQMVEHLPSEHKALNSNPSTIERERERERERESAHETPLLKGSTTYQY
jgi:hypothetical protein